MVHRATHHHVVWPILRRLLRRNEDFAPGDGVVFVKDGSHATVNRSGGGYSHVYWDDEPAGEFGGSRVPNRELRREPPAQA